MLRLKGITKNYKVANGEIKVLKGLDISFRKNEIVSILGPSGCGKTTTLNIVGGLDKYTSGDLIIAGKSTKDFTDRDWDLYRNQRIGFVFQNYNLIPHQTVLGNVELGLAIAGVSKEERKKRALMALHKVGLEGEEYKRPNQLSGGQSQRVAIARALVNEPDILLADEPTGALDSKTSVQIMDLIREISKDKLVIMVTHNSEIAEKYSTRIIRLKDGEVVSDSNPFSEEDEIKEVASSTKHEKSRKNKAKMSWWTAFKLSFKNLFSKRARTILTTIASSIGIIGISAVIAVSTGVKTYIASMQDDMLSGNPIIVSEEGYNLDVLANGLDFNSKKQFFEQKGYVNVDSMVEFLAKQYKTMDSFMVTNELTDDYVEYVSAIPSEYASLNIDYDIDFTNNVFTDFKEDKLNSRNISLSAIQSLYTSILKETDFKEQASFIASLGDIFKQAPNDNEYILSQYKLLTGNVATEKNQLMLVVNQDSVLTDLMLAQLGYYSQEEFINIVHAEDNIEGNDDPSLEKLKFTYEELVGKTFTYYPNDSLYIKSTNPYTSSMVPFTYNHDSSLISNKDGSFDFEIVGILCPKDTISFGCLSAGIYYTSALSEFMIEQSKDSEIVSFMTAEETKRDAFMGTMVNNTMPTGITYEYDFTYEGQTKTVTAFVGQLNTMAGIMNSFMGSKSGEVYELTLRNLGGKDTPFKISIYPKLFEYKDWVTTYLDLWNEDVTINLLDKELPSSEREDIVYTDALSVIITLIDTMINIVTIALVAFTSLSLVVSCVMIAIITYVSVVERTKEIGVIRSLGGRKRDVSNLFNAETLMLGASAGLFGVGFTYLISLIANTIVKKAAGFSIMVLPITTALIMVGLSAGLTILSGLIPARKAAHKDPVVALRTE